MTHPSVHTFNILVMGLAYTIDSPIRVAHLGISSVISIMDDELIEKMNAFYQKVQFTLSCITFGQIKKWNSFKNNLYSCIQYYMNLFANTTYFKSDTLSIQQQINHYQAELNDIKIPETVMA